MQQVLNEVGQIAQRLAAVILYQGCSGKFRYGMYVHGS